MSVFQCRSCGGMLDVKLYSGVCRCGFCGTEQSVPRLGLSEKQTLVERAENYRRNGDHDGALMLYEQALSMEPEDADIYWAIVLCRYGVEYVYDPAKKQHIPTINRTHSQPVSQDSDYLLAMKYGDEYQQSVFRRQAEELDRIQNEILAAAKQIAPFDIFICYKESDGSGRRTPDSVIAGELYRRLTGEGYSVFFSRVTLEDKAGSAYEPYIYSALNSSKVMLVVAANAENLRTPWVRNEWNRFLSLAADGKKTLAVLAKGFPAKELPEELRHLQMTDMEKLGWEQDLIHGLEKLIRRDPAVRVVNSAGAAPLIRRAKMFLEDGEFQSARECCDRALDQEPENAEAYFTMLLAQLECRSPEELDRLELDFTQKDCFVKAERFAQGEFRQQLRKHYRTARIKSCRYVMQHYSTEAELLSVAEELDGFAEEDPSGGLRELVEECRKMAAQAHEREQEQKYRKLLSELEYRIRKSSTVQQVRELIHRLEVTKYGEELMELADQRLEELTQEEEREQQEKSRRKRRKKTVTAAWITSGAVTVAAGVTAVIMNVSATWAKYDEAVALREAGEFTRAYAMFVELGNFRDSHHQRIETEYQSAVSMLNSGNTTGAREVFVRLSLMEYADSAEYLQRTDYAIAEQYESSGEFELAAEKFGELGRYSDSRDRSHACWVSAAGRYAADGDYTSAAEVYETIGDTEMAAEMRLTQAALFISNNNSYGADGIFSSLGLSVVNRKEKMYDLAVKLEESSPDISAAVYRWLGNYSDCGDRLNSMMYGSAKKLLAEGDPAAAVRLLEQLGDYSDSEELYRTACYSLATDRMSAGDYQNAAVYLGFASGYKDADDLLRECRYQQGLADLEAGSFNSAIHWFEKDPTYMDSAEMLLEAKYRKALKLRSEHLYDEADRLFSELGDYSDAAEKLAESQSVRISQMKAGDNVYFGSFVQSGKTGAAAEPVEWVCVEVADGSALLVSKKLLTYRDFGGENWADSSLRSWLNGEFYNTVFTGEEKSLIQQTELTNPDNAAYGTWGGLSTVDNVFILSSGEAQDYFPGNKKTADKTGHANALEGSSDSSLDKSGGWWLRSVGKQFNIDCIDTDGFYSEMVYSNENFVRPCIRISCGD